MRGPQGDDETGKGGYRDFFMVFGLTVIATFVVGGLNSTLGVVLEPLREKLQWSSSMVSALPSSLYLTAAFAALLGGWLLTRISPRVLMTFGVSAISAGLYLASMETSFTFMLMAFAIIGLGYGTGTMVSCYYVAARHIRFSMTMTMSFFLFGVAVGTTLTPLLVSSMMGAIGWRGTFALLALGCAATTLPITLFLMPGRVLKAADAEDSGGSDPRYISKMPKGRLGLLLTSQMLFSICIMGVYIHYVGILNAHGTSLHDATLFFSSTGLISALSPFALGWTVRRSNTLAAFFVGLAINIISIILLYHSGAASLAFTVMATALWGSSSVTSTQLIPVLIHEAIPDKHVSAALGISAFVDSIAAGIGPLAIGSFADFDPTYNAVLIAIIVALCLSALPLTFLRIVIGRPHIIPVVRA